MNIYSRTSLTQALESNAEWDVVIIGGGATGLGVALDSVTRGYKTLLLEQADFAKGTSSRSTKLVHGGVRYLAQGNVDLVKEALYERGLLLKNAAHLAKDQSFIIPNYKWFDGIFYTIGLKVYDFLAGKLSLGKSIHLGKNETLKRISTIKPSKLKGGVLYHDGQFDDSRLAVNVAQTCIEQGAVVLNHFKVQDIHKDANNKINGVLAKDIETDKMYSIKAKAVINATGIFTDDILKMDNPKARNLVRPSQGVHLVLDKSFLPGTDAIMIPKTDDGRVLFLVPWHDKIVVGTTDTLLDEHSLEPVALEEEIEFILKTANNYLTKKVTRDDVLSIFAGLRPLAAPKDDNEKTKEISRSHKIIVSESKLITITGGKWTTFRRMAQDTVDKAIETGLVPAKPCKTKNLPIHGSTTNVNREDHLYIYGTDQPQIHELIKSNPKLGKTLHPQLPFLEAEVIWAARYEMARTVEDVLARRVRALFLNAEAAIAMAPKVAEILAKESGQTEDWQKQQVTDFINIAKHYSLKRAS